MYKGSRPNAHLRPRPIKNAYETYSNVVSNKNDRDDNAFNFQSVAHAIKPTIAVPANLSFSTVYDDRIASTLPRNSG